MKRHSTTLIIMEMKSKATTSQPPLGWLLSKSSFASPRRIHKVAQVEQKHQTFCNLPYEELVQLCRPQKLLSQAWRGSSTPCYSTCVRPRRRHHPRRSLRWQTPAGHAIPPKMGSMVGIYKGSTFTQSPTHPGQHRDHSSGFIPFKWPAWPKMSQTSLLKKLFYQGSEEIESSVHYLWESKMVKMPWKIVWWFLKKNCKHMLKRTESGVSKMHSSIIYKSKKVEATQMPTDS